MADLTFWSLYKKKYKNEFGKKLVRVAYVYTENEGIQLTPVMSQFPTLIIFCSVRVERITITRYCIFFYFENLMLKCFQNTFVLVDYKQTCLLDGTGKKKRQHQTAYAVHFVC